jgi:hypothetical protein
MRILPLSLTNDNNFVGKNKISDFWGHWGQIFFVTFLLQSTMKEDFGTVEGLLLA